MNELEIVRKYNLRVGDRLVREKGILSTHHGIFCGWDNDRAIVAENQNGYGVQYITLQQFVLNNTNLLKRIVRFKGNEFERNNIIPRIDQLIGRNYDLVNFNCEHFAEYIQNGVPKSNQVTNAAVSVGLILLGYALFTNQK